MPHNDAPQEAVTIHHSVKTTKAEISTLLSKEGEIWPKKFDNFVMNVETLAFRQGALAGALLCAVVCVILLLVVPR